MPAPSCKNRSTVAHRRQTHWEETNWPPRSPLWRNRGGHIRNPAERPRGRSVGFDRGTNTGKLIDEVRRVQRTTCVGVLGQRGRTAFVAIHADDGKQSV